MDTVKALWVDLETTGIDENNAVIIEIAALYNDQVFHEYILPDFFPGNFKEIEKLTGITWEFLQENGISEKEMYQKFIKYLDDIVDKYDKTDKMFLCGYSIKFDSDFIRALFKKYNNNFYGSYFYSANFDVMSEVAEKILTKGLPIPDNFQLSTVCKSVGIEFIPHSAYADISATRELHYKLQETDQWKPQQKDIERQLKI